MRKIIILYTIRIEEKSSDVNMKFVKRIYKIVYFFVNINKSVDFFRNLFIMILWILKWGDFDAPHPHEKGK